MIVHAILRIGIIRTLNDCAGRLFRATIQHRQNNSDNQSKKDSKDQKTRRKWNFRFMIYNLTNITVVCTFDVTTLTNDAIYTCVDVAYRFRLPSLKLDELGVQK